MVLKKSGCSEQNKKQEQSKDFRYDCENFVGIAKNFAIIAKNFAILEKLGIFAKLAKFR